MADNSNDIVAINQIQLLLSEKRTALSIMRTGIAILALPLSIFSALIATSKMYEVRDVWLLLTGVAVLNTALILFAINLIFHSITRLRHYETLIRQIKQQHPLLKKLV